MEWFQTLTPADLRRVKEELIREIKEDADWYGRDHLARGRWAMAATLEKMAAATPPPESQIKNP